MRRVCLCARRDPGGRPGERIGGRPVAADAILALAPCSTSPIEVLRPPLEFARDRGSEEATIRSVGPQETLRHRCLAVIREGAHPDVFAGMQPDGDLRVGICLIQMQSACVRSLSGVNRPRLESSAVRGGMKWRERITLSHPRSSTVAAQQVQQSPP
jgi:hypothetical protein